MLKKKILLAAAVLLAFGACQRIDPVEPEQEPEEPLVQPKGYLEIIQAYKAGLTVGGITFDADSTRMFFSDLSELSIAVSDLAIDDCREKGYKQVTLGTDGQWSLDGEPTGLERDVALADTSAFPIYVYFWNNALRLYLNSGHQIRIEYKYIDRSYMPIKGNLPIVYLYTDGKKAITSTETYVDGDIKICDPDHVCSSIDEFSASMRIRGRGNSTWGMPKKPYKVKLDSKAEILGMPKDKEWCLLANYADKTLIRNQVAMELSRLCGFAWTPKMKPVEVYLNDNYLGEYVLSEHKKVSASRVNIDVDAGDIYLEVDARYDGTVYFNTSHWGIPIVFSDPEEPTAAQQTELKTFFTNFENALAADKAEALDYIDVDSFVNYYIVNELTKNVDGNFYLSTFFTKKPDGKLTIYHVWDFDLTLGNCDYMSDNTALNWYTKTGSGYYRHLFKNKEFVQKVKDRWNELYPSFSKMDAFIDQQSEYIWQAQRRNFDKWRILSTYVWPNYKVTGSYDGEIDWLKEFYNTRLEWLNTNINAL